MFSFCGGTPSSIGSLNYSTTSSSDDVFGQMAKVAMLNLNHKHDKKYKDQLSSIISISDKKRNVKIKNDSGPRASLLCFGLLFIVGIY